jgi:hypothetical protein
VRTLGVDERDLGLATPAELVAEARGKLEPACSAADDHDPMQACVHGYWLRCQHQAASAPPATFAQGSRAPLGRELKNDGQLEQGRLCGQSDEPRLHWPPFVKHGVVLCIFVSWVVSCNSRSTRMKIYSIIGYFIITFYVLACVCFAPEKIGLITHHAKPSSCPTSQTICVRIQGDGYGTQSHPISEGSL